MFCPNCGTQNADNAAFCSKCGNKLGMGAAPNMGPNPQMNMGPAPGMHQGTGLQRNVAALLSYIAGWITGLVFYFIEKDKFVRFHAMQSIITFAAITLVQIIIGIIPVPIFSVTGWLIKGAISTIVWIGTLILWIICMIKAYQNEWFKLPLIGNYAEKFSK